MKNDFRLSEKQVDALMAKFRQRRDEVNKDDNIGEHLAWSQAIQLVHDAQMAALTERASKRRQPLDLRACTDR